MTVHVWPIRVYYEDTDLAGVVYHANHLKFIERARSEMVRAHGIDQAAMREDGIVFAVHTMEANWIRPAHYDDELVVTTRVTAVSAARFFLSQIITRGETTIFEATVTIACMTVAGRPVRLPETVRRMVTKD